MEKELIISAKIIQFTCIIHLLACFFTAVISYYFEKRYKSKGFIFIGSFILIVFTFVFMSETFMYIDLHNIGASFMYIQLSIFAYIAFQMLKSAKEKDPIISKKYKDESWV